MNEADTCRTLVRPKLESSGWDGGRHFYSEQTSFTDGRIIVPAGKPRRLKKKFSDFLLRYTRDITLAVVEAKSNKRPAGDGLQQAKDYATILGLKFREAEICFAEITTDNPNVWFELGYALAFDKLVCMVCSEERQSKFPFDIQHRKVLRYSVGSSSDFLDLSKRITERLHGLIERRKGQATIESLRPTVQTAGLTPHEVTALAIAVSGSEETFDLVSVHQFKSMMERAGFNETASGLSIRSLTRKRMVEIREIEGGWNQNGFNAVVPTESGVDWLLHNQDKLTLNATKATKRAESDMGFDDVPF